MKRFVFRLARLERVREVRRREARAGLAVAMALLHDRQRERAQEQAALAEAWQERIDAGSTVNASELKALARWRQARGAAVAEAERQEAAAQQSLADAVRRHELAAREHRVIERLRERRRLRWRNEAELEEQKFLDEVAILRAVRERSGTNERAGD